MKNGRLFCVDSRAVYDMVFAALGPAFADLAPGLAPFDWFVGIVVAAIWLVIYQKSNPALH